MAVVDCWNAGLFCIGISSSMPGGNKLLANAPKVREKLDKVFPIVGTLDRVVTATTQLVTAVSCLSETVNDVVLDLAELGLGAPLEDTHSVD